MELFDPNVKLLFFRASEETELFSLVKGEIQDEIFPFGISGTAKIAETRFVDPLLGSSNNSSVAFRFIELTPLAVDFDSSLIGNFERTL